MFEKVKSSNRQKIHGFTPCKAEQPLQGMELPAKEAKKTIEYSGNLFRKNLQLLKATKIIGQRKAFYKQRIPESNCPRKEPVDMGIIITSKNGDRTIMQSE